MFCPKLTIRIPERKGRIRFSLFLRDCFFILIDELKWGRKYRFYMENAHSEDVAYVKTLVFSSASFVIIVVLQISF